MARIAIDSRLAELSWADQVEASYQRTASTPPMRLKPVERAVLYLRAVAGRAEFALSSFYLLVAAREATVRKPERYTEMVLAHNIEFVAQGTVAMTARKIFDTSPKTDRLSAHALTSADEPCISKVCEYWQEKGDANKTDLENALTFMRRLLVLAQDVKTDLPTQRTLLSKRVRLLKRYADRESAHIGLNNAEFAILDMAQVVAVLTLMAALIRHYDRPSTPRDHFMQLDSAARDAAVSVFPTIVIPSLFEHCDPLAESLRFAQFDETALRDVVGNRLLDTLGWW
jgi:hypothetical protein